MGSGDCVAVIPNRPPNTVGPVVDDAAAAAAADDDDDNDGEVCEVLNTKVERGDSVVGEVTVTASLVVGVVVDGRGPALLADWGVPPAVDVGPGWDGLGCTGVTVSSGGAAVVSDVPLEDGAKLVYVEEIWTPCVDDVADVADVPLEDGAELVYVAEVWALCVDDVFDVADVPVVDVSPETDGDEVGTVRGGDAAELGRCDNGVIVEEALEVGEGVEGGCGGHGAGRSCRPRILMSSFQNCFQPVKRT